MIDGLWGITINRENTMYKFGFFSCYLRITPRFSRDLLFLPSDQIISFLNLILNNSVLSLTLEIL